MVIETPWENAPKNIDELAGFVYLITNRVTGQKYIGKKYFWQHRTKRVKGRKNRKHYVIESDWRQYKSSSKDVENDINRYGIDNFSFRILECHGSRRDVNYREAELQFMNNVLNAKLPSGLHAYYNKNILQTFYRS